MKSILIVRLSALGDVIHVLPSLRALRVAYPTTEIGWAVEDRAASLLRGHPDLDRLHVIPRRRWVSELKSGRLLSVGQAVKQALGVVQGSRYEVALDFQANLRSASLTRFSGAPQRIGQPVPFAKEGSGLCFTATPDPVAPDVHKIDRNLALLQCLGLHVEAAPRPLFPPLPPPPREFADLPRPRVLIHAGVSAFGAIKAWGEDRFASLARALTSEATVLLAWGSAGERRQAQRLAALVPGSQVAPPNGDLLGFCAMLRAVDLLIAVDSGPLHLASALGIPTVGLYGPKHPGTYGPFWEPYRVARSGEECSPCRFRRCPLPEARLQEVPGAPPSRISPCMDSLSVEAVLTAACQLLEGRGS